MTEAAVTLDSIPIVKPDGTPLKAGDIRPGTRLKIKYPEGVAQDAGVGNRHARRAAAKARKK